MCCSKCLTYQMRHLLTDQAPTKLSPPEHFWFELFIFNNLGQQKGERIREFHPDPGSFRPYPLSPLIIAPTVRKSRLGKKKKPRTGFRALRQDITNFHVPDYTRQLIQLR